MATKEKKVSANVLIKSSFWYTLSHFLTKAMAFITTPIFARLLTKSEYGDFSVFASWQSIFLVICGLEVYATLNRARFDYRGEEKINSYISSCLVLSSTITAIVFAAYFLFPKGFQKLFLLDHKYIFWMFAYIFTYPAIGMFQVKQRVEYRYRLNALLSFFLIITSSLLAVALVYYNEKDRLMARISGQYGPYIVVGLVLYFYFLTKSRRISFQAWRYAFVIAIPLAFSFLGSHILLSSDKVVVRHMCSSEEVALLGMATTCSHIILIFTQALNNAWSPWFYDKLDCKEYSTAKKSFNIYLWFVTVCTLCVLLVGPEILEILGGKEYEAARLILPVNMLCGVFTVLTSQFVNLETYYKKTHYSAVLTSIVTVVNIVLDILGVSIWGYQAACYVTALCQILLISLHYVFTLKMDVKNVMSLKSIVLCLIACLLLIPFNLLLYQNSAIRWTLIGLIAILVTIWLIIKREQIIYIIKRYR